MAPLRCTSCRRLSLKQCRASARCIAWGRVREKFDALIYVPDGSVRYSKAAGKFVVPFFKE